jgi:hypothetical protein
MITCSVLTDAYQERQLLLALAENQGLCSRIHVFVDQVEGNQRVIGDGEHFPTFVIRQPLGLLARLPQQFPVVVLANERVFYLLLNDIHDNERDITLVGHVPDGILDQLRARFRNVAVITLEDYDRLLLNVREQHIGAFQAWFQRHAANLEFLELLCVYLRGRPPFHVIHDGLLQALDFAVLARDRQIGLVAARQCLELLHFLGNIRLQNRDGVVRVIDYTWAFAAR